MLRLRQVWREQALWGGYVVAEGEDGVKGKEERKNDLIVRTRTSREQ